MKVAVTGATGFLGRYLLTHLLEQDHTCRGWSRPSSDRTGLPNDGIEWLTGELSDARSARDLVAGCDAVIHAALDRPGAGFRGAEGDVLEFARRNVMGTLQLIEAARAENVPRFVFISTCAVHERILDDRPLDEKHPRWPTSHYGAHKAALEMFVHSYGWGQNYQICALRPTGIYGVSHPVEHSKWFSLVRDVAAGKPVTCRSGGKEVHAMDVARAAALLLQTEGIAGECFNCYDRYVSEYEVAMLARAIAKSDAPIDGDARFPKHQIETSKLRELGMTFGGEDLLRDTVAALVQAARPH
jgi:nucleoside-diphosphate-sugar epimerase